MHAYIYVVKLLSGPSLAFSGVIIWAKWGLLSGPSLFLAYLYSGFKQWFAHSVIILCSLGPVIRQFSQNRVFFFKLCAKTFFFNFLVLSLIFEFFDFAKTL